MPLAARFQPKEAALVTPSDNSTHPTCHRHVWVIVFCAGIFTLPAAPAFAEPINPISYQLWQWNGFARKTLSQSSTPYQFYSSSQSSAAMSLQLADKAAETKLANSISGFVYLDVNANGIMETVDWAIPDMTLKLTKLGGSDPAVIVYTQSDGSYTFTNIQPGTYSITMVTNCPQPGAITLGQLYDKNNVLVPNPPGPGEVVEKGFANIVMDSGYSGVNYNFAELMYPADAVSKRLLIDGGSQHVPEPGMMALLASAGAAMAGFFVRRRAMR
jgi:hypothetical protein